METNSAYFLAILINGFRKNNNFGYKDEIIILDNSSVHKTNDVKNFFLRK